jgi:hypothetical protein
MDFNVNREQWVDRFAIRFSQLDPGAEPSAFVALASGLWETLGQVAPETAAESEYAVRSGGLSGHAPFETTQVFTSEGRFEQTERIPVERMDHGEYVRDTDEWIARCVGRVLELDPVIKAEEARRSVADLAALERWRLMKPEAAAEQLYTPITIKPRPA